MSFNAAEQVPSGVVQKLPSTVTKDAGRLTKSNSLIGCSKCWVSAQKVKN